ncbi:MAG: GNAT family N-acetyltransferase [bacterium]|nr:GNAT family N-acetyltransferase [bacterium]
MELIKAEESQIPTLVRISKEAFDSDVKVGAKEAGGPPGYASYEWHVKMMQQGHLFAAVEENKIIGGAILFHDEQNASLMYVGRIFVDPSLFHRGYGLMLMNKLEQIHSEITIWQLETPIWNMRTNNFYKKLGYSEKFRDHESVYYQKVI